MVSNSPHSGAQMSKSIEFAGDHVRLYGKVDYPAASPPQKGYPLIFLVQHATCTSIEGYEHIAKLGTEINAAVFRWDKRGTGKSGTGPNGSIEIDTLKAYQTAIEQPNIDSSRVVIFAQNEGTTLIGNLFLGFTTVQKPLGCILAGNMLDQKAILSINVPVHIVVSKNDWNAWQIYAEEAADTHAALYHYHSSFYVATNSTRRLMYTNGDGFHRGAEASIKHWLRETCQIL
jgi:alpha-beta hydrolase superfamily lysophospholipase